MKIMLTSDTHYGHSQNTHQIHAKWLQKVAQEIDKEGVQLFIHAGDWTSNQQHQFERTLKMFRNYIKIPIVTTRGNHDLWDARKDRYDSMLGRVVAGRKMMWERMDEQHMKWFKENDIWHLETQGKFVIDDVVVLGFDGWYYNIGAPTNDGGQIVSHVGGDTSMVYHSSRAYKALDRILLEDISSYRKAVCVSHFPPFTEDPYYLTYCANPAYFQPIKDMFDAFCVGHSHKYWNEVQDDCHVLNCGSGYDKPRYIIFEV